MKDADDLSGKVIVITGANSGIGFEAARVCAARGATLCLVCRNRERGEQAIASIRGGTAAGQLVLYTADLSSLADTRRIANEIRSDQPRIDVLCNNAGGANAARQITSEGFEKTFVTNHLSGFLLTQLLLPALLAAASHGSARVVFTSSLGHKNSPLDFTDLNLKEGYSTLRAYGRSKLMNLLTARELQRRHGDGNLVCSSFHPGAVRTPIWRKGGVMATLLGMAMYPFMRSVEHGADTLIWLATSEDEEARQAAGQYFFDRRRPGIAAFATDDAARQLWHVSQELVSPYLNPVAVARQEPAEPVTAEHSEA